MTLLGHFLLGCIISSPDILPLEYSFLELHQCNTFLISPFGSSFGKKVYLILATDIKYSLKSGLTVLNLPAPHKQLPLKPFNPERITESILSLSDMAVLLTRNSQEVLYCSNSIVAILGIKSERILGEGWAHLYSAIHPADQRLLEKKGWPQLKVFLKQLPAADRNRCTFNYTARVCNAHGNYVLIAFENQPMEWVNGNWPDMYMTLLKNITPFGNKEKMVLTVSRQDGHGRYEVIHELELDFAHEPFTKREVEIIRLVAAGFTSKQIAHQLNVSQDTVRNHRKHILKKAECSSSTELSSFAVQNGIL